MSKTILEKWDKLKQKAKVSQKIAGYFWASNKTSDEEKFHLNRYLLGFETNLYKAHSDLTLSIIQVQLLIDAIDLQTKKKTQLFHEYLISDNKEKGYQTWLHNHKSKNDLIQQQTNKHLFAKERE